MDGRHFEIIFRGHIEQDRSPGQIKNDIATRFKLDPGQIEAAFQGREIILESGLTQEQAMHHLKALRDIGARAVVQAMPLSTQDLQAAFTASITPAPSTLTYRLGIALVALAMIMLPLVYLALIALAGFGIYFHATHSLALLSHFESGSGVFFAYVTPLVAGVLLVLFMIKPLFHGWNTPIEGVALDPARQPRVFEFVHLICDAASAPHPARILVNNKVNALAGFTPGLSGFINGRLTLTLGLPLVAGLNTRQLGGILAHEFGHFAQGAGLRLYVIIQRVNFWLHSAVYERDAIDAWVERHARSGDGYVIAVLQVTQGFVWLTRELLKRLILLGHTISALMSRQMEFDADRYEARFAGSGVFAQTTLDMQRLNYAHATLMNDLQMLWHRQRHLVDNLPIAIAHTCARQDEALIDKIRQDMEQGKTHRHDSHPCDRDRIDNARRESGPGIFELEYPATALFDDFDHLARKATQREYREEFQLDVRRRQLLAPDDFEQRAWWQHRDEAAYEYFFQDRLNIYIPIAESAIPVYEPAQAEHLTRAWEDAYLDQQSLAANVQATNEAHAELDTRLHDIVSARFLVAAGFNISPREFQLSGNQPARIAEDLRQAQVQIEQQAALAAPYAAAAARRMRNALAFLGDAAITGKLGTDMNTAARLLSDAVRISDAIPQARELRYLNRALALLLENGGDNADNARIQTQIAQAADQGLNIAQHLQQTLRGVAYPFTRGDERAQLGEHLSNESARRENPLQLCQDIGELIDEVFGLHWLLWARLASITLDTEVAAGLLDRVEDEGKPESDSHKTNDEPQASSMT